MSEAPRIWTIPAGVAFVDALAAGLLERTRGDPLRLAAITVLLPNRRAARSLRDAFLRRSGGAALLLPRMRPLGEVDEDELATLGADLDADDAEIPPAIRPLRRTLLLARLVLRAGGAVGVGRLDQAMRLASELARLIDEVQTAGLTFDNLAGLVPDAYAAHWRTTLRFLAIATDHWPRILAAEGRIDPADRRNRLLASLASRWRAAPPADPVIAAGSTGSIPATADLLAVIARMPTGEVVLPGLDQGADAATWDAIGDTHPQAGLKRLLDHLGLARADVRPWPVLFGVPSTELGTREALLGDALRPPETVAAWRDGRKVDPSATLNLLRVDCPSPQAEAGAIAARMRIVLDTPGLTAALVTRDRTLAERVSAELSRWGITVDDSAGRPLAVTPAGAFLRLTADLARTDAAPLAVLAAFKHPLAAGGLAPGAFRGRVRRLELTVLRGTRPGPGFSGLARAAPADLRGWLRDLAKAAAAFLRVTVRKRVKLADLVREHVRFAEWLAATDLEAGAERLWSQDSGVVAADLLAEAIEAADAAPNLAGADYATVLDILLSGAAVRPRYGAHPRLAIWGPLEARLQRADVMILGDLNEGSWPPEPTRDPWLSRPMRAAFGLPSRERRIGQAAHDFVQGAAAPEVMMTRAARVDGAPTVPARYLVRLETMLKARESRYRLDWEADSWLTSRANLDRPSRITPMPRPRPMPPLAARPRKLSVTQIEQWLRDPYAIYARWALGLARLEPLDPDPDAAECGTFVHQALDRFAKEFPDEMPKDAVAKLIAIGGEIARDALAHPVLRAFWWPRFERIAAWFVAEEAERRPGLRRSLTEVRGSLEMPAPAGGFTVTAKADRVDVARDGTVTIIDYKTGRVPSQKDVRSGTAPQLPLEAAIAMGGGFAALEPCRVSTIAYWSLRGADPAGAITAMATADGPGPEGAMAGLADLVAAFDDPAMPYLACPRPDLLPAFNDFDHLERREEWLRDGSVLPPFRPVARSVTRSASESRPEQRALSDPDTSAWVAASAGTGKTKVLTDRVLRLLLGGAAPEKVLCLTFTKAAAAEMATRIERQLAAWTTAPGGDLAAALHELTGVPADGATLDRARRLFAATIEAPGGLRIMTIHGFCQALLGRFPLEAGIAPGFDVMDERSAAEARIEARDAVLAAGADGPLADTVATVARYAGDVVFARLVDDILGDRARIQEALSHHGGLDRLQVAVRRELRVGPGESPDALIAAAVAAVDDTSLRAAAHALALAGESKTDRERGEAILSWLRLEPARRADTHADYVGIFITDDGGIRARLATKPVEQANPGTIATLQREAERCLDYLESRARVTTADATTALVRLSHALIDSYQRTKAARGLLDYEDLVIAAAALVTRSGQAPWVLFKLDGGLDHILVDEAQDTSPAQWRLIMALVDEFFAGEGAAPGARTLFVVGDEKQSIFSFQGANLDNLVRVRAELGGRARAAGVHWLERPLERSFRSTTSVLAAVDAVFAAAAARDGVAPPDQEIRHEVERVGQAGLVEIWPLVAASKGEPASPWSPARDYLEPDEPIGRLADHVATTIEAMIASQERLPSRDRPIRPSDVLVLVQRRDPFLAQVVRALQRRDVPVAGADRVRLAEPLAVRDLVALGRVLLLPEDDLTLAAVLKGPFLGLTEDALFLVAHGRAPGVTLWQALGRAAIPEAEAAYRYLNRLLQRVDYATPFGLYSEVLNGTAAAPATSGRSAILARLGPEAEDPIDEFLSLALHHEQRHIPSLESFLHWFEAGDAEVKRDPEHGREEVQVITVHGAKGLQRPIVFLPDTTYVPSVRVGGFAWAGRDGRLPLWSGRAALAAPLLRDARDAERKRELAEYRRLLYVALTRAEDRLYVGGWATGSRLTAGCWYGLVRDALEGKAEPFAFDRWDGTGLRLANEQSAPAEACPVPVTPQDVVGKDRSALGVNPQPEPPVPTPLAPSRPDVPEPPGRTPADAGLVARQRGRLLHRLLELLAGVPPARRPGLARRIVRREAPTLTAAASAKLARDVAAVLDDPELAHLFADGSRAEVPIVGQVGRHLVSGQVDRLVVSPDRVTIVDFKSERAPPARAADTPRAYLRQMASYRAVLRLVFPDHRVTCALLWTEGPRWMLLTDDLLDGHAP